jgi:hypothetical protein
MGYEAIWGVRLDAMGISRSEGTHEAFEEKGRKKKKNINK